MLGLNDALRFEILADLGDHRAIAALLEFGQDDGACIVLSFGAAQAELSRRPETKHLVAARSGLEPEFLVVRELLLEAFFALVECRGHCRRLCPQMGNRR